MKRLVVFVIAVVLGSVAFAQVKDPASTTEKRMLSAADDRLKEQMDYWFKKGDYPRCVQILRMRYELDPTSEDRMTDLGWMYENMKRDDDALAVYVRYRQENPSNPDAPFAEASFYFNRKLYAKVVPLLEPTIASNPHANSYRLLAHSYDRMGQLQNSLRIWNAYVKVHPEDLQGIANRDRVAERIKTQGHG